jgi:molybdate transport system regulatory protein
MSDTPHFQLKTRIWVENGSGEMVFGLGRLRMLEAIGRTGSISAAAKDLGMSYKAVWERLRVTEERLGRRLVLRQKGGAKGGSSELSDYAKQLMEGFRELHRSVVRNDDRKFEEILQPIISSPAT